MGAPEDSGTLQPVSGDASNRRYFRASLGTRHCILVEAPPDTEKNPEFLAVRQLFEDAGVRVPGLYGADLERGFLLLEDLGDRLLLPALRAGGGDYHRRAFDILLRLAAIDPAKADLPPYDAALLREESGRFGEWFAGALLGLDLAGDERSLLEDLSGALVESALAQPRVVVHRDFHSRNLMLLESDALAVIDFQDAVAGPLTYDLVSLLRDCYLRLPPAEVLDRARQYREQLLREDLRDVPGEDEFLRAFDWMGLQRHIKVLGTFARLYLRDGKDAYLADLPLVIDYTREITAKYAGEEPAFAEFRRWYDERLAPLVGAQDWGGGR